MVEADFEQLLTNGRLNAILAWLVVGVIGLTVVESYLTGDLLWAAFATVVGLIVLTPAIGRRSVRALPPWEVVCIASLPIIGRSVATFNLTSDIATYLSIAALALIVAVNLHAFTAVKMNVSFAILFVVVATVATVGVWAVVRWTLDLYLGTELLLDPALTESEIEHELMLEFVACSVAGLVAGVLFEGYVRRRARVPERVAEVSP
jgi:hypothetical protein